MKRLDKDLLETAKQLLDPGIKRGRPRQTNLRRAISTAYYAVFHSLCHMCADAFIGNNNDMREAWRQVYRSLGHGYIKDRCASNYMKQCFPLNVRNFCFIFKQLQEKRHEADYNPLERFLQKDVEEAISQADIAISLIEKENLELKHRRAFAAWVLFKNR